MNTKIILPLTGLALAGAYTWAQDGNSKPNVILFIVDDLGYCDLSCYGSSFYETPNIDRLASEGVRFTSAYAGCALSSPTRASIMTGKNPARVHITHAIPIKGYTRIRNGKGTPLKDADYRFDLPLEEYTVAEAMKAAGYSTATIGKWHISEKEEFSPLHQGFDLNVGGDGHGSTQNYFYPYHNKWRMAPGYPYVEWNTLPDGKPGEYITDRLTDEAVKYIGEHKDSPFFLVLSHFAVHTPLQAKQELVEKYLSKAPDPVTGQDNAVYAAMIESVDQSLGRVMDSLEKNGLEDNTVILFMSDNGGHGRMTVNWPLRGNKGNFYEGGIRIPMIIKAPDVNPAVCDVPVTSMDCYPTVLELSGLPLLPEQHVDGESLVPLLEGKTIHDRDLYWHFPNYTGKGHPNPAHPLSVIRSGNYKLIESLEDGFVELYDLSSDISEQNNIAAFNERLVKRMLGKLERWRSSAGVQMPSVNENYEPNIVGKVICDGKPVGGVVVSDGENVVRTDKRGFYSMISKKPCGYVFISVPGGYEVPCDDIIPRNFGYLSADRSKTDTVDFQLKKVDNDKFTLYVTTDIHLSDDRRDRDLEQFHRYVEPDLVENLEKEKGNVYMLCLGDMSTDVKWHKRDGSSYTIKDYRQEMHRVPVPVWHIPGNHDNERKGEVVSEKWDSLAQSVYRQNIGPNYYSMNIGRVHFLMLDCVVALGPGEKNGRKGYLYEYRFDKSQIEWMERDLSTVSSSTPLIVCLHIPPYTYSGVENGKMVFKDSQPSISRVLMPMLKRFQDVRIFGGHYHRSQNIRLTDSIFQHTFVSMSAVSWMLNGPHSRLIADDGTPAGYYVFRFDGREVKWQFKAVGYAPEDNQFRAFDMNTVPEEFGGAQRSNKVLVNVYNWDEEWKVEMFEDGKSLDVRQVYARDPLYRLVREPELPERPGDFLVSQSAHFFMAESESPVSEIDIVVTDRFGNVYKQKMHRPKRFSWNMD